MAIIYLDPASLPDSSGLPEKSEANNLEPIQEFLCVTLLQAGLALIPISRNSLNGTTVITNDAVGS